MYFEELGPTEVEIFSFWSILCYRQTNIHDHFFKLIAGSERNPDTYIVVLARRAAVCHFQLNRSNGTKVVTVLVTPGNRKYQGQVIHESGE